MLGRKLTIYHLIETEHLTAERDVDVDVYMPPNTINHRVHSNENQPRVDADYCLLEYQSRGPSISKLHYSARLGRYDSAMPDVVACRSNIP